MAYKGNLGCELYLDQVPIREENMKPWEMMLSESQERMLFLVEPGTEKQIKKIADKYFLEMSVIGKTTYERNMKVYFNREELCDLSLEHLVNAPNLVMKAETPSYFYVHRARKNPNITKHPKLIFSEILKHPNIASKEWVYKQYDYKVGNNTVITPGKADASIIWIKDSEKGIAMTIDGNGPMTFLNPYEGSRNIVFEAARNLVSVGAIPKGVTDNMNFGNPEQLEVAWQFEQSIKGISSACRELETPEDSASYPTPVIGMVGEVKNINNIMTMDFKFPSDLVYLVGKTTINRDYLGGSLYQDIAGDFIGGEVDKVRTLFELGLHKTILELIKEKTVNAVHDVSKGGISIALAEMAIKGEKGFKGVVGENNEEFFGENQSRFIVTVPSENKEVFLQTMAKMKMEYKKIGRVLPEEYGFDCGFGKVDLEEMKRCYYNSIPNAMED
jgi:phosphoribosylformylglycinamidine synthase